MGITTFWCNAVIDRELQRAVVANGSGAAFVVNQVVSMLLDDRTPKPESKD